MGTFATFSMLVLTNRVKTLRGTVELVVFS
jgi:hypothetical protein